MRIKIPTNFFAFFIKLIKFQFKLIYIGIYLLKLKKKLKCDEIMKRVQSSNCRLVSMDIMFNPKVDKPVKDWHADQLHNFYGDYLNDKPDLFQFLI